MLGDKENDISFSVAWALSKCPAFLREFVKSVLHLVVSPDSVSINMQHYEEHRGITDIELELPGSFFVIIEGAEIVTNMHSKIREIPKQQWEPYFLCKLGRPFAPGREVRVGRIYRNGRVWCMLDTLFTSKTIAQARDHSKKRWEGEEL